MQRDFNELDFYEYVAECFRLIEDVCEILIKKYFSLMLYIKRLLNGNIPDLEQIQMMKFGQMYNELKQSSFLRNILGILQSEVSISQWRNIACHKSYECVGERILCKYGENLEKTVMVNSKEDLLNISLSIYKISQLFTISSKFFLYDNIHEIRKKMDELSINICNTRDEDWQLIFVTELYANGFELLEIKEEEGLIITVQDMTQDAIEERLVGIQIMEYKCWLLTGKELVKVIYVDSKGIPCYSMQLSADVCEKVSNYEKDLIYLADKVVIEHFL